MRLKFVHGVVLVGAFLFLVTGFAVLHSFQGENAPQQEAAENYTIPIGVTTMDGPGNYHALIEHYIEPEVRALCEQREAPFTFEFIIRENKWTDALPSGKFDPNDSQALLARARAADEIAYNITLELIDLGVKAVVGHPLNYQNVYCYQLMRDAGMTQISTNDAAEITHIEGDRLFRLVPPLSKEFSVIAKAMLSRGFDRCLIVGPDLWEGLSVFEDEYTSGGGEVLSWFGGSMREETLLRDSDALPEVIRALEAEADNATLMYGADRVAVMMLYYSNPHLVREASKQPFLSGLSWFGWSASLRSEEMLALAGAEASKLGLVCPVLGVHRSDSTSPVLDQYLEEFGEPMSPVMAATIDASFIMVEAIIEVNGTDPLLLSEAIPSIADEFVGLTGRCALNEYGDKVISDYELWGYAVESGAPKVVYLGRYDSAEDEVVWER